MTAVDRLRALHRESFPAGSMGPKVDAVRRFVELTWDRAAIGRLEDAVTIIDGDAGTIVTLGATTAERTTSDPEAVDPGPRR